MGSIEAARATLEKGDGSFCKYAMNSFTAALALAEAAQRCGDWYRLTMDDYSDVYDFPPDGDLDAEDLQNHDALNATLDRFLSTLPEK